MVRPAPTVVRYASGSKFPGDSDLPVPLRAFALLLTTGLVLLVAGTPFSCVTAGPGEWQAVQCWTVQVCTVGAVFARGHDRRRNAFSVPPKSRSVQKPAQLLREFPALLRQRNGAALVGLEPAALDSKRHGFFGGAVDLPDGSPLHRIAVSRFAKGSYQRKGHCFGLGGHLNPEAWV